MRILNCNIRLSFILFLFISGLISGCKTNKIIMKPEPEKGGINTANQKGNTIDYDEAVKRHFEMQSDRTKQMMLKSDKNKKHYNAGISRTWYDNLFNNSCFRNSKMVKTGHGYVTITSSPSCFIKE